jgi:uncharacterized membrane protein
MPYEGVTVKRTSIMGKTRLEAFSDGVMAIIITIMVLDLHVPHGHDFTTLCNQLPIFLNYVLSFIYVGIYWNNHHHMLHTVHRITGGILWANSHLLFWLSLLPVGTAWMGENPRASVPTALYGGILLMAAIAYFILQSAIIRKEGGDSLLARAVGDDNKGKLTLVIYVVSIGFAFFLTWVSQILYAVVALIWLVPDRRIEHAIALADSGEG